MRGGLELRFEPLLHLGQAAPAALALSLGSREEEAGERCSGRRVLYIIYCILYIIYYILYIVYYIFYIFYTMYYILYIIYYILCIIYYILCIIYDI